MVSMFAKTKKLCDSFLEMGVPGFDLAVYKDGKCVLRYMGGYSDLENKIPMKGNERYNIFRSFGNESLHLFAAGL